MIEGNVPAPYQVHAMAHQIPFAVKDLQLMEYCTHRHTFQTHPSWTNRKRMFLPNWSCQDVGLQTPFAASKFCLDWLFPYDVNFFLIRFFFFIIKNCRQSFVPLTWVLQKPQSVCPWLSWWPEPTDKCLQHYCVYLHCWFQGFLSFWQWNRCQPKLEEREINHMWACWTLECND